MVTTYRSRNCLEFSFILSNLVQYRSTVFLTHSSMTQPNRTLRIMTTVSNRWCLWNFVMNFDVSAKEFFCRRCSPVVPKTMFLLTLPFVRSDKLSALYYIILGSLQQDALLCLTHACLTNTFARPGEPHSGSSLSPPPTSVSLA